jgi:hypothetical protein
MFALASTSFVQFSHEDIASANILNVGHPTGRQKGEQFKIIFDMLYQ